jgi:hypothetical protein
MPRELLGAASFVKLKAESLASHRAENFDQEGRFSEENGGLTAK